MEAEEGCYKGHWCKNSFECKYGETGGAAAGSGLGSLCLFGFQPGSPVSSRSPKSDWWTGDAVCVCVSVSSVIDEVSGLLYRTVAVTVFAESNLDYFFKTF